MNHLQNYITETVLRKVNEKRDGNAAIYGKLNEETEALIEVLSEELDNLQQRCENLESLCNP